MNENWRDKLINAHLEEPNGSEPSLGFESRLLAQVAEQRATRKRPVLWMVWASAVAATIVAILFVARPIPHKPALVETAKNVGAANASAAKSTELGAGKIVAIPAAHPGRSNSKRKTIAKPYPDDFFGRAESGSFFEVSPTSASAFPSASPITREEQMLLTMVGTMSGTQKQALVEALEASRIPDAEPVSIPESNSRPVVEIKNTH